MTEQAGQIKVSHGLQATARRAGVYGETSDADRQGRGADLRAGAGPRADAGGGAKTMRPCDNPFRAQRLDALRYAEDAVVVDEVIARLGRKGYRGALVGPHGTGKTTLLREVGDRLIENGLSPMPLFMNSEDRGTLPRYWRAAIRTAGHGDALLLDGYDLLPRWARAWVLHASRGASAVVVTSHRRCVWTTVAKTASSPAMLARLVAELAGQEAAAAVDCEALWLKHRGNLRDALRELYDLNASQ